MLQDTRSSMFAGYWILLWSEYYLQQLRSVQEFYPPNIYLFKFSKETLEKGVKYV